MYHTGKRCDTFFNIVTYTPQSRNSLLEKLESSSTLSSHKPTTLLPVALKPKKKAQKKMKKIRNKKFTPNKKDNVINKNNL